MRVNLIFSLWVLMLINTSCFNQRSELSYSTYSESADPEQKNLEKWMATGRGLHLSYGSKDIKYKKGEVPMLSVTKDMQVNAWRGETVSIQAVMWSSYDVKQVECEWVDLVGDDGDTIKKDIIQTSFVRYMMSDATFVNEESPEIMHRDSTLQPDMLDHLPGIDMEAQTVRPLWIKLSVPQDAKPGLYRTFLKVYSKGNPPQELRLELNILDKQLPGPEQWRFHTNMCINPVVIADWHKTVLWSSEHFNVLQPYVELMKRAGQKSITAFIFDHCNDVSHPLVKWHKKPDGKISADFTNFDRWVNFLLDNGISTQIDCYAFEPNIVNKLTLWDENNNRSVIEDLNLTKHSRVLKACYSELIDHLIAKGWFERTVFVVNEGQTEEVSKLKALLSGINKDVKLELLAHEWTSGLLKDVYAANVPSQYSNLKEWFKIRHRKGLETSYQLDANSSFPNLFLHSPSAESAWFGWYASAQEIDGIHIEAFNNWLKHPLTEARLPLRSSGSSYLIYPGARSSIRYERLIEGIQDFEKIRLLREELGAQDNDSSREKIELIDEILSDFVIDRIPRESAAQMVSEGQELLRNLSQDE